MAAQSARYCEADPLPLPSSGGRVDRRRGSRSTNQKIESTGASSQLSVFHGL
jgi:hypothetical protein